jgi:hypothetical protein
MTRKMPHRKMGTNALSSTFSSGRLSGKPQGVVEFYEDPPQNAGNWWVFVELDHTLPAVSQLSG